MASADEIEWARNERHVLDKYAFIAEAYGIQTNVERWRSAPLPARQRGLNLNGDRARAGFTAGGEQAHAPAKATKAPAWRRMLDAGEMATAARAQEIRERLAEAISLDLATAGAPVTAEAWMAQRCVAAAARASPASAEPPPHAAAQAFQGTAFLVPDFAAIQDKLGLDDSDVHQVVN
ncbi:hypothetical protein KFE25_012044 [Diacronema lutheri]|uniref:Uncharacterized protein n=1 Tax=Diacronema lutheri TaxID=2081491 RepID=A0A8J5XD61_DIALT|nr:hypothetical protein KFE25_012044 [Diacronema lutheri]